MDKSSQGMPKVTVNAWKAIISTKFKINVIWIAQQLLMLKTTYMAQQIPNVTAKLVSNGSAPLKLVIWLVMVHLILEQLLVINVIARKMLFIILNWINVKFGAM